MKCACVSRIQYMYALGTDVIESETQTVAIPRNARVIFSCLEAAARFSFSVWPKEPSGLYTWRWRIAGASIQP